MEGSGYLLYLYLEKDGDGADLVRNIVEMGFMFEFWHPVPIMVCLRKESREEIIITDDYILRKMEGERASIQNTLKIFFISDFGIPTNTSLQKERVKEVVIHYIYIGRKTNVKLTLIRNIPNMDPCIFSPNHELGIRAKGSSSSLPLNSEKERRFVDPDIMFTFRISTTL